VTTILFIAGITVSIQNILKVVWPIISTGQLILC